MSYIDIMIGGNIRTYRRARRMTLEELASRIHKSKATAGKYEQGAIGMDVATLFEAAAALGVEPAQLLYDAGRQSRAALPQGAGAAFAKKFFYYYDGRTSRIVRSLLLCSTCGEQEPSVTLFYDVPSLDEPSKCRALYYGKMQKHDFVTNYLLENQSNGIEHVFICMMQSLDHAGQETGMISGLSSRTLLPVSAKCAMADTALAENEALVNRLLLTKEDMRLTRKCNMFTLEQVMV